ncbi:tyrosine-type recombinase/integrase [Thiomicrorhabdus sp. ZW0627]|uniref:tyrosine-type recombinase/integrase n=1 Tax=Thiomicrorhabdus sp. ZW0627 TaxID=3039774 RepID=UPI002436C822|nr:tyrosine-type recombinase/integrase [Thiomicrorhabdus sp. ZW0627]MDG6774605.1 tyrosine-type recombinase/integrase [Thiomicrorhabdus sp. ZW0627]
MKGKISKSTLQLFSKNSTVGERFNDTEQKGFHARKLKTGLGLYYRYISPTGGRKTIPLGSFPGLPIEKARAILSDYIGRIAAGEDISETIAQKKQTHANTAEAYLKEIYDSVLAKKGDGKNMRADLFNHFPELLKKPMSSLTPRMMLHWQKTKENENLNPQTIKKVFSYFNAMLNHAAEKGGVIDENPIKKFKLEVRNATPEEETLLRLKRNYLDLEQTQQFFDALDKYQEEKRVQRTNSRNHGKPHLPDLTQVTYVDYVKPTMLLLYYTGLRPGDALTLKWEEVNLKFKRLTKVINKTRHKKPNPTPIPLSDAAVNILQIWHKQNGSPKFGYVFPNPCTGLPYKKLYKPWEKIKSLSDLPSELDNYTLRHNFISHLVMNGANLLSIAKLAATSVEMIEQYYGHLQPDLQVKYVNQFASMMELNFQENIQIL